MDFAAIREGLADTIRNGVPGLPVHHYVPESVAPPCAFIALEDFAYADTFGRATSASFSVTVLVAGQLQMEAQRVLEEFAADSGTKSIYAAIEADPTLDDTVAHAVVVGGDAPGQVQFGDKAYPALSFRVEVIVS